MKIALQNVKVSELVDNLAPPKVSFSTRDASNETTLQRPFGGPPNTSSMKVRSSTASLTIAS